MPWFAEPPTVFRPIINQRGLPSTKKNFYKNTSTRTFPVTASMNDITARTCAGNDAGFQAVDSRINDRLPQGAQRHYRESTPQSFTLEILRSELPSRMQTDSRINLSMRVSTCVSSQPMQINPQELIAVIALIDNRTGNPLPPGYLVPTPTLTRSRLIQSVGPTSELAFQDLLVKQPGVYQLKVTLLRMPEASTVNGRATHIVEWESDIIRIHNMDNGA